jgi:predicted ATP-dependent endonuclease of OLD family
MRARLKIQNFGPIGDLDIQISKFNVLIGPQGFGKSTISKVLCVIHSFVDYFSPGNNDFSQKPSSESHFSNDFNFQLLNRFLIDYRIENFYNPNTYYFFENDLFLFELDGINITIKHKKLQNLSRTGSFYFPAERIALPMIGEALFELVLAKSILPSYFLQFGKDFIIARNNLTRPNIPILNVEFEHSYERNVVKINDNKSLFLEETSSAIQANLPLLVILDSPYRLVSLVVIEELELHGFPSLQKELLSYVIGRKKTINLENAIFMLPTHSPYILSAANNLLFAAKVAKQNSESAREVDKIISKDSWINKEDFSAFYIADGKAVSIVNEETGLIDENELDGISEDLAGEFDALMNLYKPVNA